MIVYNKEFLIAELHRWVEEFGVVPNAKNINKNPDYPAHSTYQKYFGSWNDALKEAKLEVHQIHNRNTLQTYYTDEELINYIKMYYIEYNKIPTVNDFNNNSNYPSPFTYTKRFGKWNNALKEAGFKANHIISYSDEDLINEFHRFVDENGFIPTIKEFSEAKGFPSIKLYMNRFVRYNNLLYIAGLID